nr:extensin family protein [Kaistia nematophila]
MYSCVALRIASVLALVSLSGCALNFLSEQREGWRDATERACYAQKLVVPSYFQRPAREVDGKGACGIEQPLKVNAFQRGVVAVTGGDVLLGCMMTNAMERWVREAVQPAAQARFGMPVTEVLTMGTYACRPRNNRHGDKLSEHAFANAFDVAGFRLADGRTIRVRTDWRRGDPASQAFLREALISACGYFTTVLGPGSNRLHEDHIHIDLARHNASGTSRYCRPKLDRPGPTPLDPNAGIPMATLLQTPPPAAPANMEQRAFTYRFDDNLGAPDAEAPYPGDQILNGQTPSVPPSGPYTPPASIPLSYTQ